MNLEVLGKVMSKINRNYQESHKIKKNWESIQRLVALENQLIKRIALLEAKAERLWKEINKVSSKF